MKKMRNKLIFLIALVLLLTVLPRTARASEEITGKRRALLIGNQNYSSPNINDLKGAIGDTEKIELMLLEQRYPYQIDRQVDLTKAQMVEAIRTAYAGAAEGDLNLFFYAGHGAYDSERKESYLVGTDDEGLYASELEALFREIPGQFLVLLDACNSGGIIDGRADEQPLGEDEIIWAPAEDEEMMSEPFPSIPEPIGQEDIFSTFFAAPFETVDGGLFGSKYKVIASSYKYDESFEANFRQNWGWGGFVTRGLVLANGYRGNFLADRNKDLRVTFDELVFYLKSKHTTNKIKTYPKISNFEVGAARILPDAQAWVRHDVSINKAWSIRFNGDVNFNSAEAKIGVTDWQGKNVPVKVLPSSSRSTVRLRPLGFYDERTYYKLRIDKGLTAENGTSLQKPVVLHFFTAVNRNKEDAMTLVLDGRMEGYPNKTVGKAFAKRVYHKNRVQDFIKKAKWTYRLEGNGEHIVELTGRVNMNTVDYDLKVTYTADLVNQSFALSFIGLNNEPMTAERQASFFRFLYDESNDAP